MTTFCLKEEEEEEEEEKKKNGICHITISI
jgi:hypothetical protein